MDSTAGALFDAIVGAKGPLLDAAARQAKTQPPARHGERPSSQRQGCRGTTGRRLGLVGLGPTCQSAKSRPARAMHAKRAPKIATHEGAGCDAARREATGSPECLNQPNYRPGSPCLLWTLVVDGLQCKMRVAMRMRTVPVYLRFGPSTKYEILLSADAQVLVRRTTARPSIGDEATGCRAEAEAARLVASQGRGFQTTRPPGDEAECHQHASFRLLPPPALSSLRSSCSFPHWAARASPPTAEAANPSRAARTESAPWQLVLALCWYGSGASSGCLPVPLLPLLPSLLTCSRRPSCPSCSREGATPSTHPQTGLLELPLLQPPRLASPLLASGRSHADRVTCRPAPSPATATAIERQSWLALARGLLARPLARLSLFCFIFTQPPEPPGCRPAAGGSDISLSSRLSAVESGRRRLRIRLASLVRRFSFVL
ncbi:hypothetical protein CDD83_1520 [Cordyceps sp. RAO-2017]|nr:hypothetical protein CDD83_1520 [Cordyceps sp. RAO-2017]